MERKSYFSRKLNDREKMIYCFEKYKEALTCKKENEAMKFLSLANQYLEESQKIKEEKSAE